MKKKVKVVVRKNTMVKDVGKQYKAVGSPFVKRSINEFLSVLPSYIRI